MKKFVMLLMLILPVIIILVLNITISVVTDNISIPVEKVELENSAVVTNIGNVMTLDVNVYPVNASNKQLIWESSDNKVIQVDGIGNISFVGFGNAYVTVTTLDGSKKASCYFVVTDTIVHRVILFTIGEISEVKIGQTLQVYAQVIPAEALNKEVIFTSSNQSVASIDEQGVVTGISIGSTTIIATSVDGGHVASVDIEVYQPITSISLTNYILTEQNFYQLDCNITPSNADITRIIFTSSNNEIANVDKHGKVVFTQAGIVSVQAQYEDLIQNVLIEFTNGYASALSVNSPTKTVDYSQGVWQIDYFTTPTNLYQTEVIFETSNSLVATVNSSGLVELQGGGVCVIGVSVQKYDGTILKKNITLFVTRDCESIVAQDIVTATASISLVFTALPEDSTQTQFLFEVDSNIATVENGVITFTQQGEVNLKISASSVVSKTISVKYTGGLPTNFNVPENIVLNLGESFMILPTFTPFNTQIKSVNYLILNQHSSDGTSSEVVSVNVQGYVTTLKGGTANIVVSVETTEGISSKTIQVGVISPVTKIEILAELDSWNNGYITGNQTVLFNTAILPISATDKTLVFSINDNNACQIVGNSIVFAYPATIILTATNILSGVYGQIEITYTNQIQQVSFDALPSTLMVGDSAIISLISHIPSNLPSSMVLQIISQTTKSIGVVVSVNGNTIVGQNGGVAQIAVYVNGIYQTSFNITIIRISSSIDVYPKNITTTNQNILLNNTIMPLDTSESDVVWEIDNPTLAQITNNVLIFCGYGLVNITVTVQDESMTSQTFWIERVFEQTVNIPATSQSLQMFVGGYIQIEQNEYTEYNVEQTSKVILFNNGLIHALSTGMAVVNCSKYNEFGALLEVNEITINIFDYVQDIELNFDFYNGEYVTAQETNQLDYSLLPNENVLSGVEFSLMSTTLANIENGELVFYGVGAVTLVAVSEDKNCTKIWNIRYTGGNALNVNFNVGSVIYIEKNQSITINTEWYIPTNTTNNILQISFLSVGASNLIGLFENTIIGISGGTAQISIRFSSNIIKTVTVYVVEYLEQIIFSNKNLIISETSYTLKPTLLPISATEKTLIYRSSDESIATIQNGVVIFTKPGTVEITAESFYNDFVTDKIIITSTFGYPKNITLNTTNLILTTGETQSVYLTSFSPQNIDAFMLEYQIISFVSNTPQTQVITISEGNITAISCGTAIIKVSVINPYGMDIFAIIEVLVIPQVTDLAVIFVQDLDKVGDVFVTGLKDVDFQVFMLPANIATTNYSINISDTSVATINQETINFLHVGIVKITFSSTISPNVKTSVSINYTNNNALNVEINQSVFQIVGGTKQIILQKNSTFQFEILSILPSNVNLLNIVISQVATVPNILSLPVASVSENIILLKNGGSVTYNLNINGFDLGNFKFVVTAMASSIEIETTNIYVSVPQYTINAIVLPVDTTDKTLIFQSSDALTAQVNEFGVVEFLSTGTIQILIVNQVSSISKIITISYSRRVEDIIFNPSKTVMSVGSVLLLNTHTYPSGIEGVIISYTSSDQTIATVDSTGKVVSKNKSGIVTITAYIVGNESIATSIDIQIIKYITNIALELDSIGDNLGIGGYRVFGNEFLSQGTYTNIYQMIVLNILPFDATVELFWSSSDENIATVTQDGYVSFVGTGNVTIRVEALNQYNPNMPVFDSFTFKVVSGVNIYSLEQFYQATREQHEIILQNDVYMTEEFASIHQVLSISVYANVHGNGHILSLPYLLDKFDKLVLINDNITIDNIVIIGEIITANTTLDDLSASKVLLLSWKKTGIVLTNCVFEGAHTLVRAVDSKIFISGCVFINAGFTHISLVHKENSPSQTIVTVENSVFKDALIGAIVFDFDTSVNDTYASKLILKGNIYIYNFREKSKMRADTLVAQHVPPVLQNLLNTNMAEVFNFLDGVKHTYNGKDYYHLGILKLNLDYYLGKYQSYGTVDMTGLKTPNPYREYHGYDIKLGVTLILDIWTIMPGNITTINPNSTFDSTIYDTIRYSK